MSDYLTNLTFWLIIISILTVIFATTYCVCLCCNSGNYPGKIIELPATEWVASAPYTQPQHSTATYYPTAPGASSSRAEGPYVAMTPANISEVPRSGPAMDPSSAPPPSYDQVIRQSQLFYSPQGPAAGLPGLHGPPSPHGPSSPHGPPGPLLPPGVQSPAPYGNTYYLH